MGKGPSTFKYKKIIKNDNVCYVDTWWNMYKGTLKHTQERETHILIHVHIHFNDPVSY